MADTLQIVSWSLEQSCPFRHGERWQNPEQAAEQLIDLRILARAACDGRIVNQVCVTSWSHVSPFKSDKGKTDYDSSIAIPISGFDISDRFAKHGGLEFVSDTCTNCEANTLTHGPFRLAGCHGHLQVWPETKELEALLRQSLNLFGVTAELFDVFHETTPIWYGLWIDSPLRQPHARVLRRVLDHAFAEVEDRDRIGMGQFLKALAICEQVDIPLHVSLAPPGHTDLGWYTVFPHCPRCKAHAPVARWQERYSQEEHTCQVCGHRFKAADTHRQEKMDWDMDANSLEKQFGFEAYGEFVRTYAESQGFSAEQARAAWEEELRLRDVRQKAAAANRERWKSHPSNRTANELEKKLEVRKAKLDQQTPCPECGKSLRTSLAKQCFECGADWH